MMSAAVSVRVAPLRKQIVGAAAARVERRARHGEDLAALLERETRGDQRARLRRRLDHDDAERHARDDAVAAREMARLRLGAERQFGDDRAVPRERLVEAAILLRDRRCRRRRRRPRPSRSASAPRCAAASMPRASPETTTIPASPSPAARSRARRRPLAEALRAPTTATIGARSISASAEHGQHRRRILDRGERARIERLAPADEAAAEAFDCRQFRLGLAPAHGDHRARRRCRRGSASSAAAAEPKRRKQRVEGDRPDALAAAEAQPVEAFLRFEFARGCRRFQGRSQPFPNEIRLSVPARSRRMLSWWRRMTSSAMPAISQARAGIDKDRRERRSAQPPRPARPARNSGRRRRREPQQRRERAPPARRARGRRRAPSPRPCRRESRARPETCGRARRRRPAASAGLLAPRAADQHGGEAFRQVEQQGQRGERLVAGAQHVGRADIARADLRGCRRARRAGSAAGRTGSSRADSR